jgi:hypothetical protein
MAVLIHISVHSVNKNDNNIEIEVKAILVGLVDQYCLEQEDLMVHNFQVSLDSISDSGKFENHFRRPFLPGLYRERGVSIAEIVSLEDLKRPLAISEFFAEHRA